MEQHHSTLELVKNDETAKAPECDHDATAFELDASALAPQVVPDTAPQVLYVSSLPEAHGDIEESGKERASSYRITKATHKWVWVVVALTVVVVIGVGAGVGTRRHRDSPQYILNDTSLAALSFTNGDRHLYFQGNTGFIHRAVRSASNGRWIMNTSSGLTSSGAINAAYGGFWPKPRNNTPLAVIAVVDPEVGTNTEVFYVSDSYHLSSLFADGSGQAIQDLGQNRSTAIGTRSLSVTSVSGSSVDTLARNSTTNSALLYFEDETGNVSALLQHVNETDTQWGSVQWFDITSQNEHHGIFPDSPRVDEFSNAPNFDPLNDFSHTLYESIANTTFSAPFTCKANFVRLSKGGSTSMGALFYAPGNASLVADFFDIGPSGPGNYSGYELLDLASYDFNAVVEGSGKDLNYSSISQSDVATVGLFDAIWINGTQPVTFQNAPPNISFPFTRLASVDSADQSMTFLYHQIDGATFAEETWDESSNTWLATEYITVTGNLVP